MTFQIERIGQANTITAQELSTKREVIARNNYSGNEFGFVHSETGDFFSGCDREPLYHRKYEGHVFPLYKGWMEMRNGKPSEPIVIEAALEEPVHYYAMYLWPTGGPNDICFGKYKARKVIIQVDRLSRHIHIELETPHEKAQRMPLAGKYVEHEGFLYTLSFKPFKGLKGVLKALFNGWGFELEGDFQKDEEKLFESSHYTPFTYEGHQMVVSGRGIAQDIDSIESMIQKELKERFQEVKVKMCHTEHGTYIFTDHMIFPVTKKFRNYYEIGGYYANSSSWEAYGFYRDFVFEGEVPDDLHKYGSPITLLDNSDYELQRAMLNFEWKTILLNRGDMEIFNNLHTEEFLSKVWVGLHMKPLFEKWSPQLRNNFMFFRDRLKLNTPKKLTESMEYFADEDCFYGEEELFYKKFEFTFFERIPLENIVGILFNESTFQREWYTGEEYFLGKFIYKAAFKYFFEVCKVQGWHPLIVLDNISKQGFYQKALPTLQVARCTQRNYEKVYSWNQNFLEYMDKYFLNSIDRSTEFKYPENFTITSIAEKGIDYIQGHPTPEMIEAKKTREEAEREAHRQYRREFAREVRQKRRIPKRSQESSDENMGYDY